MHPMSRNIYISVVTIAKPTDWYTGDRDHDETPRNLKSLLSKILKLVIMHIKIKVLKVLLITLLSFEDFFSHYEEDDENPYNRIESIKLTVKDNVF